jgi:hypothetical protein
MLLRISNWTCLRVLHATHGGDRRPNLGRQICPSCLRRGLGSNVKGPTGKDSHSVSGLDDVLQYGTCDIFQHHMLLRLENIRRRTYTRKPSSGRTWSPIRSGLPLMFLRKPVPWSCRRILSFKQRSTSGKPCSHASSGSCCRRSTSGALPGQYLSAVALTSFCTSLSQYGLAAR